MPVLGFAFSVIVGSGTLEILVYLASRRLKGAWGEASPRFSSCREPNTRILRFARSDDRR